MLMIDILFEFFIIVVLIGLTFVGGVLFGFLGIWCLIESIKFFKKKLKNNKKNT